MDIPGSLPKWSGTHTANCVPTRPSISFPVNRNTKSPQMANKQDWRTLVEGTSSVFGSVCAKHGFSDKSELQLGISAATVSTDLQVNFLPFMLLGPF